MIHIEGTWYVDADETEYILLQQVEQKCSEHFKKITGEETKVVRKKVVRKVEGYYSSLQNAIRGYRNMIVRKQVGAENYASVRDALLAVAEIDVRIENLLDGVNA